MELDTYHYAGALDALAGVGVSVACQDLPGVPRNFSYPYKVYRPRSFSRFTAYLYRQNVERMIRRERPDILHGQMLHGGGATAAAMARKHGLPVVVASKGADVQGIREIGYGGMLNPENKKRALYAIKQADKIIALCEMNKSMLSDLGADESKIEIVYNGVAHEEINAVPFEDMRARYGISPDEFVLITVGRNSPVKRMDILYQALSLLGGDSPKIRCISVGPGRNLFELAEKYGVRDRVVLTGPVPSGKSGGFQAPPFPDLVNLMRAADLFVSVSYVESFNMSALEALACGTPVLVSQNQGIRDVIREGETGFVWRGQTAESLAEQLTGLSREARNLRSIRPEICKSVARLTWQGTALRMKEIYQTLAH